jgi:hypothetical protein
MPFRWTNRYDKCAERYDTWPVRYDKWAGRYDGRLNSARRRADVVDTMARVKRATLMAVPTACFPPGTRPNGPLPPGPMPRPPAVSNADRQRAFRKRNPGYYARLQAKKRASVKAAVTAQREARAKAAEGAAVPRTEPLMLPAPVETIEIVGVTTIRLPDAVPVPDLVEVIRRREAA